MQKLAKVQDFRPAVPDDRSEGLDLVQLSRTLWRAKWWMVLCVVLALALGWYRGVHTATPIYSATAEMALTVDNRPSLDIQAVVTGFSGDFATYSTELAVLTSGEMMERLVDELGLMEDPEFNGYLIDPDARPGVVAQARAALSGAMRSAVELVVEREEVAEIQGPPTPEEVRQVTADAVRGAFETTSNYDNYVFTITATTEDPQKSVVLANTLARLFRDDQIQAKVEVTERMTAWLSDRVGELRAELDTRQDEIAEVRARSALVSEDSLAALDAEAIALRAVLRETEAQLTRLGERIAGLETAQVSGDREAALAVAEDGQLAAAAQAAAAGEAGAEERFARRLEQLLLQAQAERDRASEQVEELTASSATLSTQFEAQAADLRALRQLEQEAEATSVLYETFLTRLREASVQESTYEADSRILTEAMWAGQIAPRPARTLALSLLLGLLLGSALVLGREFMQSTFRTAEELEQHVGRPVLGQIPRVPGRARSDIIKLLRDKPTSAAAEAVRDLRTSVLLSDAERPPQVIMTTSSVPAEGKTTVSIALAQNFAGLGKRVLLIEGDIRRRTFESYFGHKSGRGGLLSVVGGEVPLGEAVIRPEGMGVDVLLGERSKVNAADLFSSSAFRRFLEEARQSYDHIIIDTPPVLVVPDARVIAQAADAVIYIVHWDRTSRAQVQEGMRQFRSVQVMVTGLVLSRIDPKGMRRYGYGGRYGAYSRYGKAYYGG